MFWINKEPTNISLDKLLFPHWCNSTGVNVLLTYITEIAYLSEKK